MSRITLSRRDFLQVAGLAALPISAMWFPTAAAAEPAANVCRVHALSLALQDIATGTAGDLGVSIIDMASGASCAVRGDEPFPMHSSVKLIVAASVVERLRQGVFTLATPVKLMQSNRPGGVGPVDVALRDEGDQTVSVEQLLEAIMVYSDNAACDGLMALVGGPAAIDADLRRWSATGIRVDRTMGELYRPFNAARSEGEAQRHYDALLADPRDRATPTGYATFARRIADGSLLDAQATALVMGWWRRGTLIPNRITAGLGAGWMVASRSGTGPSVAGRTTSTNHAMLATSPGGRQIIVSAFLRNAPGKDAERAAVLADVGRAVRVACSVG